MSMSGSGQMNEPSQSGDRRLNAILTEYLQRKDAGQPLNEAALLRAYPDLADELRSYFQGTNLISSSASKLTVETVAPVSSCVSIPVNVRETLRPRTCYSETLPTIQNRSFGRYTILRLLGEGAMGNVYLAHDTSLDREIALKIPKTPVGENEDILARFTFEAKAAARLNHPNICRVYDADQYNGIPYITMDFIDGVPLSRFIGSKRLQSVGSVLQMISTIAEAVGHAHSKGVIHRDLKPGNILIDASFRPHITDFGLARRIGKSGKAVVTQVGMLLGTPAYMAPEQVTGEQKNVGPQSDVYSLGVLLFELLTFRLPFEGSVPEMLAQVLRDSPPPPSRIRRDLSEDIDDFCLKMLRKEPDRRYQSMDEVVTAIQRLRIKTEKAPVSLDDLKPQQSPFDRRKALIEAMLKKGQYAAAIQSMEKLVREKQPSARDAVVWAQEQLPRVRGEEKSLNPEGIEAFLGTATQLYDKYDYAGCVQLLADIPPLRRNEQMDDLLRNATRKELESETLLSDIKESESRRVMDGIEPLVVQLLKLKPGNNYAKRLMNALQSYNAIPASQRQYQFKNGRLQAITTREFRWQWIVVGILAAALAVLPGFLSTRFFLGSEQVTLTLDVDNDWLRAQGGQSVLLVDGKSHIISNQILQDGFGITVTSGSHTVSVRSGDTIVHESRMIDVLTEGPHLLQIDARNLRLVISVPIQAVDTVVASELKPEKLSMPPEITNSIGMRLKLISAGKFLMGSPTNEINRSDDEGPPHTVHILTPFYVGVTEVTQAQWSAVMKTNPWRNSTFVQTGRDYPATYVSWYQAAEYCKSLSAIEGLNYRLPTEAEWEYSCRSGRETAYSFAAEAHQLTAYAWCAKNAIDIGENFAHVVGTRKPNHFGLSDMHGNVWEWCSDWHGDYDALVSVDPQGPSSGFGRVIRGGSWDSTAGRCRSAAREEEGPAFRSDYVGFRIILRPTAELLRAATIKESQLQSRQASLSQIQP